MSDDVPSIGRRLLARGIDTVVLVVLGAAAGRALGYGVVWLGLTAALSLAYFAGGDVLGGTLGKRLLGMTVRGRDGGAPTWRQSLTREGFVVLGAIPFVGPLLALGMWIAMLWTIHKSPTGQGIHDTWAQGTRVVRV